MTTLTFDVDGLAKALIERLIKVMDILMEEFYRDATAGMTQAGVSDSERIPAKLTDETIYEGYQKMGEFISARCKFYVQAILESFGVGYNADRSADSYWPEYMQMQGVFNPARQSNRIVGRPSGDYIDIWGKKRHSEGRNVGKDLQTLHLLDTLTGEYHQVWPSNEESWTTNPTHSIQQAEDWIIRDTETKVERRIQVEVERFLAEEAGKYFIESRG